MKINNEKRMKALKPQLAAFLQSYQPPVDCVLDLRLFCNSNGFDNPRGISLETLAWFRCECGSGPRVKHLQVDIVELEKDITDVVPVIVAGILKARSGTIAAALIDPWRDTFGYSWVIDGVWTHHWWDSLHAERTIPHH